MHHAQLTEFVRKLVHDHFQSRGFDDDASVQETILIRKGYYCGRRFSVHGCEAVWFIEENQIKFFDQAGALVKSVSIELDVPNHLLALA